MAGGQHIIRELVTKLSYVSDNTNLREYKNEASATAKAQVNQMSLMHGRALEMNRRFDLKKQAQRKSELASMSAMHGKALEMNKQFDARKSQARHKEVNEMNKMHGKALEMNKRFNERKERESLKLHNAEVRRLNKTQSIRDRHYARQTAQIKQVAYLSNRLSNMALFGAVGSAFALRSASKRGMVTKAAQERTSVALEGQLGSKEEADRVTESFMTLARETALTVSSVTKMGGQFIGSGVSPEESLERMRQLGNLAGGNDEAFFRAAVQYAQVSAKGVADTRDLRGISENTGTPLNQYIANFLGIDRSEVQGLIENRKIGIRELNGALDLMAGAGGKWANNLEKYKTTLPGSLMLLEGSIDRLFSILLTSVEKPLIKVINTISTVVDWISRLPQFVQAGLTFSAIFTTIGLAIIAVGGRLVTFSIYVKLLMREFRKTNKAGSQLQRTFLKLDRVVRMLTNRSMRGYVRGGGGGIAKGGKGRKGGVASGAGNVAGNVAMDVASGGSVKDAVSTNLMFGISSAIGGLVNAIASKIMGSTVIKSMIVGLKGAGVALAKFVPWVLLVVAAFKLFQATWGKLGKTISQWGIDKATPDSAPWAKYKTKNQQAKEATTQTIKHEVVATVQVPEGTTRSQELHLNKVAKSVFEREMLQLQARTVM